MCLSNSLLWAKPPKTREPLIYQVLGPEVQEGTSFWLNTREDTTKTILPRHNCGVPSQQLCVDPGSEVVVGISQGSTAEVQPFGLTASPGLTCRVPQTCRFKDSLLYPCLATEVGLQQIICHHSMSSTGSELQCICEYATRVPQTLPHPATLPNTAPTQHTRRHRLERLGPVQAAPMVQAEPNGTTGYPCLVRVVAELLPK